MTNILKVGIVGASASRGWAKISHVPAVQQLEGLELAAVATQDQPSADAAAKAFGAKKAYANAKALFTDPDIAIVTVAVNVPAHRELVLGALAAGKHVYCEYPLGRNIAETEEMAQAARKAGVHAVIGLQLRCNPAAGRARELLRDGVIGRVLSARILSTTMAFGYATERAMAFAENPENGVTLVSIQGAHTIDLAISILGPFADIQALASTQYPQIAVEGGPPQLRITPDHLAMTARLAAGSPVLIEVVGGRPANATPFRFEVTGETGVLVLQGGAPRGAQSGVLSLTVNGRQQAIAPTPVIDPETAANVSVCYARLRDDIRTGTRTVPGFDDAVLMTRLIDDVMTAARTGQRVLASDWPQA